MKNNVDWLSVQEILFPDGIPTIKVWTDLYEIIDVINIIASIPQACHMLLPTGGGNDLIKAKSSSESGCIKIIVDSDSTMIVKPAKLIFHSFNKTEWSYFRLETAELKPIGDKIKGEFVELVIETSPGKYSHEITHEIAQNHETFERFHRGSFLFVNKYDGYNGLSNNYSGKHDKMNDVEFRNLIEFLSSDKN